MTAIDHQQAHQLIQTSLSKRLAEENRRNLEAHLEACSECRGYADQLEALEHQLRRDFHARWDPFPGPSVKVTNAIPKRTRARLMNKRFFGFGVAAALTIVLVTLLIFAISALPDNSMPLSQNQTANTPESNTSPVLSPSTTPIKTLPVTKSMLEAPLLAPTLTPIHHAAKLETLAEADLNCDGAMERVWAEPSGEPHYFNNNLTYERIVLETASEQYPQTLWEYSAQEASVSYFTPKIIQTEACEQFLATLGDGGRGNGLKVFQWDGEKMKEVLRVPGRYLFAEPEFIEEFAGITPPPSSLAIMNLVQSSTDAKNLWIFRVFQWDGVEFKAIMQEEVRYPGGG